MGRIVCLHFIAHRNQSRDFLVHTNEWFGRMELNLVTVCFVDCVRFPAAPRRTTSIAECSCQQQRLRPRFVDSRLSRVDLLDLTVSWFYVTKRTIRFVRPMLLLLLFVHFIFLSSLLHCVECNHNRSFIRAFFIVDVHIVCRRRPVIVLLDC